MKRTRQRLVEALAPPLAYSYLRLLGATMRLEFRHRERMEQAGADGGTRILAFWHSRLVLMRLAFPGKVVSLSSRHRDSRMLAEVNRRWGVEQAWGSSSEGGARGLRQVLHRMRDGYDVAWTPDGPKGPCRRVQAGVIAAARLSGRPIVPVTLSARPSRRLNSWDRTLLPYPFGRGLYLYGEPFTVARDADDAEQERLQLHLESELDRLTDLVDREIGIPVEEPRPPRDV